MDALPKLIGRAPDYGELYEKLRMSGQNVERSTAVLGELMRAWPDGIEKRVEAPMDQAVALADTLAAAGRELAASLDSLEDLSGAQHHLREVKRLEHEGDRLLREGLTALFDGGVDPMIVIRWKDIFERVEDGIDACDRVAHVLRGIIVKQA